MSRRLLAALPLVGLTLFGLAACGDDHPTAKPHATASSTGSDAASTLVQQGLDQLTKGDTAAATTTFTNVLALDPGNPFAHYNLGYLAQQAGRPDEARQQYDAALRALPTLAPALYNKAILLESTDLEQSVELYRKAVASDPKNAAAHMRLGFALVHLGKKQEGGDELAKGVELDPAMRSVAAPTYAD